VKILILSPRLPHLLGKPDSMTVYRLIDFLSERHEIYLACFYYKEDELAHLPELEKRCKVVECVRLRKWKVILNMAMAYLFSYKPLQVAFYQDGRMKRVVDELIEQYHPDLGYAHLIRMGEYLRHNKHLKRVLAMQISQTLNYRRMIENIGFVFYNVLYRIEYNRIRKYEPHVMHAFDSCLLISKHDKESLDGHETIHNVFYSPHGVDVDYYRQTHKGQRKNTLLFTGFLGTPTNMDAVLYFYREVYPLIRQRVPDVKLYLVGMDPAASIRKLAKNDSSVVVTGFVKDMRPYYSEAKVGIDPLRIGAGLQNKILVGMSMGLPMVCTSIANEGIGAQDGQQLLIADEPARFADAVVSLLRDTTESSEIVKRARTFVEEKWTWEYYFTKLEDHLKELVGKGIERG